jgi:hypothetical protein
MVFVLVSIARIASAGDIMSVTSASADGYEPFVAYRGSVVKVTGSGFGKKREELRVFVENQECFIVEAKPQSVRFVVPTTIGLGKHTVTVKRGEASAQVALTVVKPRDNPPRPDPDRDIFVVNRVIEGRLQIDPGEVPRIEYYAECAFRDLEDLVVELDLCFSFPRGPDTTVSRIDSCRAHVRSGRLRATFGPYKGKKLVAGRYFVQVTLGKHDDQPAAVLEKMDKLSNADRDRLLDLRERLYTEFGSADDGIAAEKDHREYYLGLRRSLEQLLHDLEGAVTKELASTCLRDLVLAHAKRKDVMLGQIDPEAERLAESLIRSVADVAKQKLGLDVAAVGSFEGWAPALPNAELKPSLEWLRVRVAKPADTSK